MNWVIWSEVFFKCIVFIMYLLRLFLGLPFSLKALNLKCGSHLRLFVSTYRAAGAIGRKWRHRHRGPDVTLFQRMSRVYVCFEQHWSNVTSLCFNIQLRILVDLSIIMIFIHQTLGLSRQNSD